MDTPLAIELRRLHTWEIADPQEQQQAGRKVFQELDEMHAPPASATERAFYGDELFRTIRYHFSHALSPADLELWNSLPPKIPKQDRERLRILRAFDLYLVEQFLKYGWKIFLSDCALQRYAHWQQHDLQLVRLAHKNQERHARILQREVGGFYPVSAEDLRRAEELLPELRVLLRKVRDDWHGRTNSDLVRFLQQEIEGNPVSYPKTLNDLSAVRGFIAYNRDEEFAYKVVRGGRIRAERFLSMMMEKGTGYSRGQLRNLKITPKITSKS